MTPEQREQIEAAEEAIVRCARCAAPRHPIGYLIVRLKQAYREVRFEPPSREFIEAKSDPIGWAR